MISSRYKLEAEGIRHIMNELNVHNYVELSALFTQKVGYNLSPRAIREQLAKYGEISNSLAGRIQALKRIIELEKQLQEMESDNVESV
jgi:hypothetical protein